MPIFLIISMMCNSALAQTSPNIPSPDPEEKAQISPLFTGDRAPFVGVLFSTKATATVLAELGSFQDRIAAEVIKARRDDEAQKKFELLELDAKRTREKEIVQSGLDAQQKLNNKLKDDVKRLEKEAGSAPSNVLWAGLGVAGGVLITVLITFAVNQTSK